MILRVDVFRQEGRCVKLDQLRLVLLRFGVDWRNETLNLRAIRVESLVED